MVLLLPSEFLAHNQHDGKSIFNFYLLKIKIFKKMWKKLFVDGKLIFDCDVIVIDGKKAEMSNL